MAPQKQQQQRSSRWPVALAAAAAAALVAYVGGGADSLGELIGRVRVDKTRMVRWADSAPLNNGACTVDHTAQACEDVVIHADSHTAFLACGDSVGRSLWFPPACQRNAAGRAAVTTFRETLFKHDLETGQTTQLQIRGLPDSYDFVTHGLDMYASPSDPTQIRLFAVRHARDGDAISIFSHKLGTDFVELVRDVRHPNIKNANGVAAVGELEFYMTNDYYFHDGIGRVLEEKFGPWTWATHVQRCDASQENVVCQQVTGTQPGANGIAVWKDQLFVGDAKNGTLTVFRILPGQDKVEFEHQVDLGAGADNIKVDPTTGDITISVFPGVENLPLYLANVAELGRGLHVPAAALRLTRKDGYRTPELIYYDDGGVLSFMTAMALDATGKRLVGGAVFQTGGFAVCKLGHSKAANA
ncbi:Six-bladed beta-propeller, TolB-like protein [Niveomyces insectorum RCEF 264]|uniref:Six-bladed beta-propeller, TolB-like protein n=1 Tax=Niveomyces insectorum RCEF 264 TaxID=1081102 RepID=A0A167W5W1_9HYPO|nr:Six-bladed beta-propeller, TolB-like protein [Niveomyces insectorum RCEF 264]